MWAAKRREGASRSSEAGERCLQMPEKTCIEITVYVGGEWCDTILCHVFHIVSVYCEPAEQEGR